MASDLSNLCIHTITTKRWPLEKAVNEYCKKGIGGISVWGNAIQRMGAIKAGEILKSYPIEVVSLVRGGFFAHASEQKRQEALDHNKKLMDDSAALEAPLLVMLCGADPTQSLETSRSQIQAGIEEIIPYAKAHNVKLGIEPLHPMYSYKRCAINTLSQANTIVEDINDDTVGVIIDVFHTWWDENLRSEIMRCGKNNHIMGYHLGDWRMPMSDMLNDRPLMGEGCIDLPKIGSWIKEAGFTGFDEVEVFSNKYWDLDQNLFLDQIIKAYQDHC